MSSISEVKSYFDRFRCIPLKELKDASSILRTFTSDIRRNTLANYLKTEALSDDQAGKTRVYVIQDPTTDTIVCFFSIRCGAVYATHEEDDFIRSLDMKGQQLLRILEDVRDENIDVYPQMCGQYRSKYAEEGLGDKLIRAVEFKAKQKKDQTAENCINVENAHPAIEIQHFCKCDNYILPKELLDLDFPLGFGLFWQKIVPIIKEVAALIGCEYLFLFAADKSEDNEKHLVTHYKGAMGFLDAEDLGLTLVRPDDDKKCISLVQLIAALDNSCESAWNARSDIMFEWE